eukprot:2284066-Amphidinium_carterae.1
MTAGVRIQQFGVLFAFGSASKQTRLGIFSRFAPSGAQHWGGGQLALWKTNSPRLRSPRSNTRDMGCKEKWLAAPLQVEVSPRETNNDRHRTIKQQHTFTHSGSRPPALDLSLPMSAVSSE